MKHFSPSVKKIFLALLPAASGIVLSHAQQGDDILGKVITEVFAPLYSLVVGIAFLYFLFGVVRFIMNMNDPEKKNVGKEHLLYGTIGLFIILSVGGILKLFNSVFGGLFEF